MNARLATNFEMEKRSQRLDEIAHWVVRGFNARIFRGIPTLLGLLALFCPTPAQAHIGSPDVFYDGNVGSWPTHITIRMPMVVPGRAEILVQVQSSEPVTVSCVPLYTRTAVKNAPPPEATAPVLGETNVFTGSLWLMAMGAYSIEVKIHGKSGDGVVQIPVNSVATSQLPLPRWLGGISSVLGLLLFCAALAIVAAAAGESTVPPGELPGKLARRKYWIAGIVTGVVLVLALVGGKLWWASEEAHFRTRLRDGGWPDLRADVRTENSQRILRLTVGEKDFGSQERLPLTTDHGKLLHLFLVAQPNKQAFGHLHPVRRGNNTFDVTLPPLPKGDYQIFCDLTFTSGLSSTATNFVHLPPIPVSTGTADPDPMPDPDDSWATDSVVAVRENPGSDIICHLADGTRVIWKAHPPLQSKKDAALHFQVLDKAGQPAALQPYMGMMSHAAVLRSDGRVFAHLHPSGNYSMAAQMFFDAKVTKETGIKSSDDMASMPGMPGMAGMDMNDCTKMTNMDHSMMGSMQTEAGPNNADQSVISLPYQFPSPGDYRLWVQIKTDNQIKTAIFDTTVK